MQNGAKTASGASASPKKESLRERALDELKKYTVITLYLWVLFVLFATPSGRARCLHGYAGCRPAYFVEMQERGSGRRDGAVQCDDGPPSLIGELSHAR